MAHPQLPSYVRCDLSSACCHPVDADDHDPQRDDPVRADIEWGSRVLPGNMSGRGPGATSSKTGGAKRTLEIPWTTPLEA